jgi:hypothetical protein
MHSFPIVPSRKTLEMKFESLSPFAEVLLEQLRFR